MTVNNKILLNFCVRKLFRNLYFLLFGIIIVILIALKSSDTKMRSQAQSRNRYKRDWHDHKRMELDRNCVGFGEHGKPEMLDNEVYKTEIDNIFAVVGYNGVLSNKISINRSLPDLRHRGCLVKEYYSNLPSVSVIVRFYNEHLSVLLRTVQSVINRTPKELLLEIILVDDFSTDADVHIKLDEFKSKHLSVVQIIRLQEHLGVMNARLAGAKIATGDVLVFMDSHVEATHNWLPPMLEPIVDNNRTCVFPLIDAIDSRTFEYMAQDEGGRGAFDWLFNDQRLPLRPEDLIDPIKPHPSPIQSNKVFAMTAHFFWELGGYDEEFDMWGGEHYDLSLKIWLCGGQILEVPCSRFGHIDCKDLNKIEFDSKAKNLKRVADIWMDEYSKYIYMRNTEKWARINIGNIYDQLAIKQQLKCKPFQWFLENVASDVTKHYPLINPSDYAYGVVRSLGIPDHCIDQFKRDYRSEIGGLDICVDNLANPVFHQNWILTWQKEIRNNLNMCWDVLGRIRGSPVVLRACHNEGKNQLWKYDPEKNWILSGDGQRCLEYASHRKLVVNVCDENKPNMKWEFGFVDQTRIREWDE